MRLAQQPVLCGFQCSCHRLSVAGSSPPSATSLSLVTVAVAAVSGRKAAVMTCVLNRWDCGCPVTRALSLDCAHCKRAVSY
jgi:hypothetical protein